MAAVLVLLAIAAAAYVTNGFGLLNHPAPAAAEAPAMVRHGDEIQLPEGSPLRSRLTVEPAPVEPVRGSLILPGIVEVDPARVAAVLPPLGGRVVDLKVTLGDRVERGQVLADIDSPDLAQALDDDAKAHDTLQLTTKNLARATGQVAIGAASPRDLDQARSDHAQAASEYQRTQARLRAIGVSPDRPRQDHLLAIRAPVSGSITTLSIAPGQIINDPTQTIMTVTDLSSVWVTALAPEKDLADVAPRQEVEIALDAFPGKILRGRILFVSDVLDSDSRRDKLRIAVPNGGYDLKPNMFATVTVLRPEQSQVVLPASALLMNNDRTTVFVETAPWTFKRRLVDPLLDQGAMIAIKSGISSGERVVVRGGILLND